MLFLDKCLPFGASISCAQFQKFLDALQFLAEYRIKVTMCIANYLDDLLFVAWLKIECDWTTNQFLEMCKEIRCPVAVDKMEWRTVIVFMGCLLDGQNFCLAVLQEKKSQAINQLENIINKKKVIVKELQSLLGLLNFLCWAIVLGIFFQKIVCKNPGSHLLTTATQKVKTLSPCLGGSKCG